MRINKEQYSNISPCASDVLNEAFTGLASRFMEKLALQGGINQLTSPREGVGAITRTRREVPKTLHYRDIYERAEGYISLPLPELNMTLNAPIGVYGEA